MLTVVGPERRVADTLGAFWYVSGARALTLAVTIFDNYRHSDQMNKSQWLWPNQS